MVPYDVPHVTHDMILRFMGMNFSAITDGSARIPSKVGNEEKPIPTIVDGDKDSSPNPVPVGKTPEQDRAMWEGTLTGCLLSYNLVAEVMPSVLQCWIGCTRSVAHCPCDRIVPLPPKTPTRKRDLFVLARRGHSAQRELLSRANPSHERQWCTRGREWEWEY